MIRNYLAIIMAVILFLALALFLVEGPEQDLTKEEQIVARLSPESRKCVGCHKRRAKGLYEDWKASVHARSTIGCYECHQADKEEKDAFAHAGVYVSYLVTPKDCGRCHKQDVDQFEKSLHSQATTFVAAIPGIRDDEDTLGYRVEGPSAPRRGCEQCHGQVVKIGANGRPTPETWPNKGIGRINPDGSKGNCTACHSGHRFSIVESRKPEACAYCHLGPDHPQMEIYYESVHGNLYITEGDQWKWDEPENKWDEEDFRAPTCSACHMSGMNGVKATHNVSERLSWELERPWTERTKNWQQERKKMEKICQACHSELLVKNFYKQGDDTVELYNKDYFKPLTALKDELEKEGLLSPEKFDEEFEFKYFEMWHHEGRRTRFGAFMGGPDWVQWHGFYDLAKDRVELHQMAEELRREGRPKDYVDYKDTKKGGGVKKQ